MNVVRLLVTTSPRMAWIAAAAGILAGLSSTALIILVNAALEGKHAPVMLAAVFAAIAILRLFSQTASQILISKFAQETIARLRRDMARKILSAPLRLLESLGAARLMSSLTQDVNVISDAYRALPRMVANATILVACGLYLAWLSPFVLAGVMLFGILGVFTYRFFLRDAMRSLHAARDVQDDLFGHFRSLTEGTKELKLHRPRRRAFRETGIDRSADAFRDHTVTAMTRLAFTYGWSQLIYFALIGLLLFLVPVVLDVDRMTLTSYVVTTLYLMGPLTIVVDTIPVLGLANAALHKVDGLGLELEAEAESIAEGRTSNDRPFRSLQLEDLAFTYRGQDGDGDFTLGPLDFAIEAGEIVFIIGGNGSGKSTLAKLITGLYKPDAGTLRVDGEEIPTARLDDYRQHFSTVFSDFHLFERFLGLAGDDLDERASDHLKELELDHKVSVEKGELSTVSLSQGQRKRLALLTAYLEDRAIYVFDEWAADQDPEFKDVFYRRILPELRTNGKAVIVISHDDRYFDAADRIIRLESGRMTDQGVAS